jgi:hypothetical protein
MSFFASLNALGISMLGEYVVRIYDQVRGRPLYVVDRTVNVAAEAKPAQSISETPRSENLELKDLDPLDLNSHWDDAYQHLLDQASDLLEIGALARADAADFAARRDIDVAAANGGDEPHLLPMNRSS